MTNKLVYVAVTAILLSPAGRAAAGEGSYSLRYAALTCAGIAAVSIADGGVRHFAQDLRGGRGRLNEQLSDEPVRAETAGLLTGGFLAAGLLRRDDRAMRVATVLPQAWLVNNFATFAVKKTVGRHRPYTEDGRYSFSMWSIEDSRRSFPSGHASTAFVLAASIATEYDTPWVDIPAYGFATFVGLSRVYDDMHWTSDVVAGAVLGTVTAKLMYRLNNVRRSSWVLLPSVNGLALMHSF